VLTIVFGTLSVCVAVLACVPDWTGLLSRDSSPTHTAAPPVTGPTGPTGPTRTAPGTAPAGGAYVEAHRLTSFVIPAPESWDTSSAELDSDPPRGRLDKGARSTGDLGYGTTLLPHGLHARQATAFGTASSRRPRTAEECRRAAQTQAVTAVDDVDMRPDDAFCVVTDEDRVAWLRLVSKQGNPARLVFELVVWRRS
jgi:hypothetical protein